MMTHTSLELEQARETYFAAGGIESDIGPRDDPGWYWRRAAKLWRSKAEHASARNKDNEDDLRAAEVRLANNYRARYGVSG